MGEYFAQHHLMGLPDHKKAKPMNYAAWEELLERPVESAGNITGDEWRKLLAFILRIYNKDLAVPSAWRNHYPQKEAQPE